MNTKALRQKILDLAIRGKLVPQDPNDEPAEVLLERIRKQKQQMLKEGKLKKKDIKNDTIIFKGEDNLHYEKFQDGTVKCIEDEIPFEVPKGWEWSRLNSIVDVRDGTHDTPTYVDKGIPLITSKNLVEGGIDYSNVKYISEKDAISINERSGVNIGDILFAMIGTIGNPSMITKDILISIKNVALFKFTFSKNLSNHFVMYFLDYAQEDMKNKPSGGLQPFVSLNFLRTYLVPVPPVEEQQRIVFILADSINKIRNIDVLKNELTASVEKAKSKILDLAIRGKLVPQDPNDEPASVLLERIRTEKEELIKQGKIKRDKKESVIFKGEDNSYYLRTELETMEIADELPYEIPESWEWARIGNVFQVNPRNKLDDLLEVSFIPMPLIDDGFSGKHTSEVRVWKKIKSGFTHFTEGDIGIAKITPCFENRKSVVFRNLKNNYGAGTTELHVLRPYASSILPEYVLAYVKSSMFIDKGKQEFTGAVGQQRIGKDYVENSYFPIPPLAEQKRIVEQISTVYKQLDLISNALR